jgi:hypothetical protein
VWNFDGVMLTAALREEPNILTTTYWSGIEQLRRPRIYRTIDEVKMFFYKESTRILFTE